MAAGRRAQGGGLQHARLSAASSAWPGQEGGRTVTAQLLKLARTLGVPAEQFAYLADVPDADLREFRRQVTDLFVAGQEAGLRRVAQASKVIPTPITAKMVARSRGALLAARMSGVLDPSHAVD